MIAESIKILFTGMAGIFAVMGVIALVVLILKKLSKKPDTTLEKDGDIAEI